MPEKFFDIIPPKQKPVASFSESDKIIKEKPKVIKKKRYFLKSLIGLVGILIIFGLIGMFFFSDVDVNVWPKTDEISLTQTIIIDISVNEVDSLENVISGEIVSNENSGSQKFTPSGKTVEESKAEGTIIVYNAYSTSSRTLIPSRFVSADGKLFWSVKKITIPGQHYKKGKLVPGEQEVQIRAAEAGPEYNISATTFALPALAGTALYTTIYARSFEPMTGGHIGEIGQITQADLDNAENTLIERLELESVNLLKGSLSEDFVLLDETVVQEVLEAKSSKSVGAETDMFNFDAKIRSDGLAFKNSDMDSLVRGWINSSIDEGQRIKDDSLKIEYSLKEIDLELGKATLQLDVKVKVYMDIDLTKIEKAILGKSIKEAKVLLQGLSEADRVELDFWPFFKRTIPEDMERVNMQLKLD